MSEQYHGGAPGPPPWPAPPQAYPGSPPSAPPPAPASANAGWPTPPAWSEPRGWPSGSQPPGTQPSGQLSGQAPAWAQGSAVARVLLQPMDFGEMLDRAVKMARLVVRPYLAALVLAAAPFEALLAYASRNSGSDLSRLVHIGSQNSGQVQSANDKLLTYAGVAGLLVVFAVASFGVARAVALAFAQRSLPPLPLLKKARCIVVLLVASVLVHVLELFALVLIVLPAFAVMAMFAVTAPAIVVEGRGPFSAMGRSWKLVSRRFWPVLGMTLLAGIMGSLLADLVFIVPEVLVDHLVPHVAPTIDAILATVAVSLQWAFMSAMTTLIYLDLRVRREGLDLEAMVAGLG